MYKYKIEPRTDKCVDEFEFLFNDDTLINIILDYLHLTVLVNFKDIECIVIEKMKVYFQSVKSNLTVRLNL